MLVEPIQPPQYISGKVVIVNFVRDLRLVIVVNG